MDGLKGLAPTSVAGALCLIATTAMAQDNGFVTKENAPPAFGTPAQEQGMIANVCGTQLAALGAAGCACLAERAMKEQAQAPSLPNETRALISFLLARSATPDAR